MRHRPTEFSDDRNLSRKKILRSRYVVAVTQTSPQPRMGSPGSVHFEALGCNPNHHHKNILGKQEHAQEFFDDLTTEENTNMERARRKPLRMQLRHIPGTQFGPGGAITELRVLYHSQEHPQLKVFLRYLENQNASTEIFRLASYFTC